MQGWTATASSIFLSPDLIALVVDPKKKKNKKKGNNHPRPPNQNQNQPFEKTS